MRFNETWDEMVLRLKAIDFDGYINGVPGRDGLYWFTISYDSYFEPFSTIIEMKILDSNNVEEFKEILDIKSYHRITIISGPNKGKKIDPLNYIKNNIKMKFVELIPPKKDKYGNDY